MSDDKATRVGKFQAMSRPLALVAADMSFEMEKQQERIATLERELAEAKAAHSDAVVKYDQFKAWTYAQFDASLEATAALEAKWQVARELLQRSKPFVEGVLADPIPLGERERLLKLIEQEMK